MICDCGEELLICDSGMKLCSVGCKDRWVNSKGEEIGPLKPQKKMKFVVKNIDWVWCCGNKIPKDMEAVGCSDCF